MSISTSLLGRLTDPTIIQPVALVAGRPLATSSSGRTFSVVNPATGEVIATLPDCGRDEARAAIDAAYRSQRAWAQTTAGERADVLHRLYALMLAHADDLATILTMEMGKPLAEARGEILYGAGYVQWFAEEARRLYGDIIPGHARDKRIMVWRQPVGVVAAITPWNFPNAMIARKVAPALAAGCAIIVKPAALTPLSAIAMGILAERAGLPAGLLSMIPGTASAAIGDEFCASDKVRKLTFTGSTEVGRLLMRQCADTVKRVSLELGGNAPFIVFDDADPDAAVEGAIAAKFRNSGQTCVCANRIYVQSGIYDVFADKLARAAKRLVLGNGLDAGVTAGPMIEEKSVRKVEEHIADALARGAGLMAGGARREADSLFFTPTVLRDASSDMLVAREEIFGPVAPLFRFDTVDDVIAMANDTEFGLASYFYARDVSRVWKVAEALEFGIVGVNTGSISTEVAPFGGIKQSGMGREGSKYGLDDYTELKYICMHV